MNELVAQISERSSESSVVLAGPDSPEVYYLSHASNPTRVLFDFLSSNTEPPATTSTFLETLDLDLFVDNRDPAVSSVVDAAMIPDPCTLVGSFGPRDLYDCA